MKSIKLLKSELLIEVSSVEVIQEKFDILFTTARLMGYSLTESSSTSGYYYKKLDQEHSIHFDLNSEVDKIVITIKKSSSQVIKQIVFVELNGLLTLKRDIWKNENGFKDLVGLLDKIIKCL